MKSATDFAFAARDIFVLPDTVTRIKELIDDDNASMQDMAQLINFDPVLAGQLLKLANSALYRFPSTITSLDKALQVIGTASMYDLVVAYSVAKAFSNISLDSEALERFWERSVTAALLAKYFADINKMRESERLFVAGLLHNIGELVVMQLKPELGEQCKDFCAKVTPLERQLQILSFSYADVGAELITGWRIPNAIAQPIRCQHTQQCQAKTKDDRIVQLACLLALENHYPEFYLQHSRLEPELYEVVGLDKNQIQQGLNYANLEAMAVLQMFSPKSFSMH